MLSLEQCDLLLGSNPSLDDVRIIDAVADPTHESTTEWLHTVASMIGTDAAGIGGGATAASSGGALSQNTVHQHTTPPPILDVLESVLEATEREWFVREVATKAVRSDYYAEPIWPPHLGRPKGVGVRGREASTYHARKRRERAEMDLATAMWEAEELGSGLKAAKVMGLDVALVRNMMANHPVSFKTLRRAWAFWYLERHPGAKAPALGIACSEFLDHPARQTLYAWIRQFHEEFPDALNNQLTEETA